MLEEILQKETELASRIRDAHETAQANIARARADATKRIEEKRTNLAHALEHAVTETEKSATEEAKKMLTRAQQETQQPHITPEIAKQIARTVVDNFSQQTIRA